MVPVRVRVAVKNSKKADAFCELTTPHRVRSFIEVAMSRHDSHDLQQVKVFTATTLRDRPQLGEAVTEWLQRTRTFIVESVAVRRSSGRAYHCLSIVVFYRVGDRP